MSARHHLTTRTRTVALTAAAIAAMGAGTALTTAGSASAHSHPTSIHLVAGTGKVAFDDLGDSGPSLGDTVVLNQPLTRHGKPVGRVHNVGVEVDTSRQLFQATGTLTLHGGTVEFAGLVSQTPHFVLAVTGGTGRYQGASGHLTFDFPHNRQLITLTLHP